MRAYSKITPQFWIGATGKALRGDLEAQVVALHLMTGPHSDMTGAFHCPVLYIAHETGLPFEGASKALQRLCEGGFCLYDEASEWVFVFNMARFQIADTLKPNDNRVKGLREDVKKMPQGIVRQGFLSIYNDAFSLGFDVEKASPLEAPSEPLRSQEQEQEQEQEQKKEKPLSGKPDDAARPIEGFADFWSAWPRKVAKGEAEKAWMKLKPDETLQALIVAAVKANIERNPQWSKDGGQFIPHPATWLRARQWDDEIGAVRPVPVGKPQMIAGARVEWPEENAA